MAGKHNLLTLMHVFLRNADEIQFADTRYKELPMCLSPTPICLLPGEVEMVEPFIWPCLIFIPIVWFLVV